MTIIPLISAGTGDFNNPGGMLPLDDFEDAGGAVGVTTAAMVPAVGATPPLERTSASVGNSLTRFEPKSPDEHFYMFVVFHLGSFRYTAVGILTALT